ncbi:dipeptidase [Xylophilus rhododendri]|uniref:Dipeptidase n=1 Tax=Xylophilus rhododendri TaxID=2697032 RepID=A0A857JE32_9BURK|nr:membrane dipeptidase [Xylophilus rhododendri]QHJ00936.1 dipeptidase [Xylophilus rhododendri]
MPQNPSSRIVIDGLVFHADGNPEPLRSGGVTAANITVAPYLEGAQSAFDAMSRWRRIAHDPASGWKLVEKAEDIAAAQAEGKTGLIMGWQNTWPLEGSLDRITGFHALGLRVAQLTYNEANFVADGCSEERNGGLTGFGRKVVQEFNRLGIAIDLSHCSERTVLETCELSSRPVFLTHANAKAVDARVRNKSDEAIRAVARTGGVIGTSIHGFLNWNGDPQSPPTLANFIKHVRYIADLVGIEHVGIGTDFACVQDVGEVDRILELSRNYPGPAGVFINAFGNKLVGRYPQETPTPRDFPLILQALEQAGFSASEVDGVAGGNFLRAFGQAWA